MDSRRATTRPARGGRHGFTLIEMAMVLIIIGIIASLVIPIVGEKLVQDKLTQSRESVNSLKQEIIGYVRTNMKLPAEGTVETSFANARDAQQNYIAYYVDPALKNGDICARTSTNYTLEVYDTGSASVSATYGNLAFILVSRGVNQNLEINSAQSGTPPNSRTVRTYTQSASNVDVVNADPPNTSKGPYDLTTADANARFDDLVEYMSLASLQNKIGCSNADKPIGAAVGFDNVSQDFPKTAQNFSAAGSTDVLKVKAKSLSLGNEQSNVNACIWSNATVPDANRDGVWDGMSTQTTGHWLGDEHFVCRTNSGPDHPTGGNDVVFCYGYNNATNPGNDPTVNMVPWTSIAAVFKFSALYPDTSQSSLDYNGGFIFSLISANASGTICNGSTDNCGNPAPCSDETAGSNNRGPYLGWSDSGSGTNTIYTPKIGVEVDFFPDVASRSDPDAAGEAQTCNQTPMTASNHVALVYYANSAVGAATSSISDNLHGAAIGTFVPAINPEYAPEHPSDPLGDCSQETLGIDGFATNATAWSDTSRHKQWLEDSGDHWIRIQIDRNPNTHVYVVHFWLDDTPNNTFLNVDRVNGPQMPQSITAADYYENKTITLQPEDDSKFNYFRFGWTFGFGSTGDSQTINLSKFGLNATR